MPQLKQRRRQIRVAPTAIQARLANIDREQRTADVVLYSGAPILRGGGFWGGEPYELEFSLEPGHTRLERLRSGLMPLLEEHGQAHNAGMTSALDTVLGVFPGGEVTSQGVICTVRFGTHELAERRWQAVLEGLLGNVSVGAFLHVLKDVTAEGARRKRLRAIDWEPFEGSLVAIGADPRAAFLSAHEHEHDCALETLEHDDMTPDEILPSEGTTAATATEVAPAARASQGTTDVAAAEMQRGLDIRAAVRRLRLGEDVADRMVADRLTVDEARSRMIDLVADRASAPDAGGHNGHQRVQVGERDVRGETRAAMVGSLLHRFRPDTFPLTEQASRFRHMRLTDIAAECLTAAGISTRGSSPDEIARLAMQTTSDFPNVVRDAANNSIRRQYQEMPRTWEPITVVGSASDFKAINRTQLSAAPTLEPVGDSGEIKTGSLKDSGEAYVVVEHSKIIALTRKALVNDSIDAFTRVPQLYAAAAARTMNDFAWRLITTNANMADGNALFSSNHGNLGVQILADETDLAELALKLRQQTGQQGEHLNLGPKVLIVPPQLELVARKLIASLTPAKAGDVNPWAQDLSLVVEPRLGNTAAGGSAVKWYMAADKAFIDILEVSYLDGVQVPRIESEWSFDVSGMRIKCTHDFGFGVLDWRGIARSDGTT